LKTKFVNNGIPALIGEFGVGKRIEYTDLTGVELTRHLASRTYYYKKLVDTCNQNGVKPFNWDNGFDGQDSMAITNRTTATITDPACEAALTGGAAQPPP